MHRQESAAELRQLKATLSKAYTELKARVMEGLSVLRTEEEAFGQAHAKSLVQLRDRLAALRAIYDEEVIAT